MSILDITRRVVKKRTYSEEELAEHLMAGDPARFGIVYDHFSPYLFGIIKKIVTNEKVAEDLLQETFMKIWNSAGSYDRTKSRLFTWMLNIARNSSIDYLRSGVRKFEKNTVGVEQAVKLFSSDETGNSIGLLKVVRSLKEEHLQIIQLAYFEGYTQTEIADRLSIPLGTVKTRCRSALQNLRAALSETNVPFENDQAAAR